MSYNIEIIRENKHITSKWSGGTTTELYICPVGSIYDQRNFKWRISSAKVEVVASTFTPLPGISRLIMVIEGELQLKHEGHHTAVLGAFEQDCFSGNWETTSFGCVTDFNLMMARGYKGTLEAISFKAGEVKDILLYNNANEDEKLSQIIEAFYIVEGAIEIDTGINVKTILNKGDLVLAIRTELEIISQFKILSNCQEEVKIIKAIIFNYE